MTDSGQANPPEADEMKLDLVWPDEIGAQAEAVNQVLFAWDQAHRNVVYMYLGHVPPPPWLTEEVARERVAAMGHKVPVEPKGSFVLSLERAEELWAALGKHLGKFEQ